MSAEELPPEARRDAWEAGGPPLWFTRTWDRTTGETSQGAYLVTYTGWIATRSLADLRKAFAERNAFSRPIEEIRESIKQYFLAIYRKNPAYKTHDLEVRVYGPFKTKEEEARRLCFPGEPKP